MHAVLLLAVLFLTCFRDASVVLIVTPVRGRWYVLCSVGSRSCLYVDHRFESFVFFFFFSTLSFYLQKSQPNETWQQVNKYPYHFDSWAENQANRAGVGFLCGLQACNIYSLFLFSSD